MGWSVILNSIKRVLLGIAQNNVFLLKNLCLPTKSKALPAEGLCRVNLRLRGE
ncbi:hypothetical protein M23134_00049 [Microscilla marina ATCC 23134]|uniref:Uncharacterized protein n=1 Tax=Microscilla marina ATCC 23134 TaxID=313606 RepID=A1ZKS8_MICM2|nr:hypothetical protein M23134_00049 [Microscilla marina ATCC 23134]